MGEGIEREIQSIIDGLDLEVRTAVSAWSQETVALDDLFKEIAEREGTPAFGRDLVEAGRRLIENRLGHLQPVVCGNPLLRRYCQNASVIDGTTASCLIAGALTAGATGGLNVPLVACILARIGVRSLCAKTWDQS